MFAIVLTATTFLVWNARAFKSSIFDVIRIEAENLELSGFRSRENRFSSGGLLISASEHGTAKGIFHGKTGTYDIVVAVVDSGSPVPGSVELKIGDQSIKHDLNVNIEGLVCKTFAQNLHIEDNSSLEITGVAQSGEVIDLDYVDFIPSGSLAFQPKNPERAYVIETSIRRLTMMT